jgi:hypothetical protein
MPKEMNREGTGYYDPTYCVVRIVIVIVIARRASII